MFNDRIVDILNNELLIFVFGAYKIKNRKKLRDEFA